MILDAALSRCGPTEYCCDCSSVGGVFQGGEVFLGGRRLELGYFFSKDEDIQFCVSTFIEEKPPSSSPMLGFWFEKNQTHARACTQS